MKIGKLRKKLKKRSFLIKLLMESKEKLERLHSLKRWTIDWFTTEEHIRQEALEYYNRAYPKAVRRFEFLTSLAKELK